MSSRHRRRIAYSAVYPERRYSFHIFVGNFKAEYIGVVPNSVGISRLRNGNGTLLHYKAYAKLGYRNLVFFGKLY